MSYHKLAETHGLEKTQRVIDEARRQFVDLGLDIDRTALVKQAEKDRLAQTHVVVGDHQPEPRTALCASHAPDRGDDYVVPASASHGPR